MDLLLIATAFIGGIGCLVMHPGAARLWGLVGPGVAIATMQRLAPTPTDGTWEYLSGLVVAAVAGGWAFGYGRMAKLRAIADAD